MDKVEVNQTPPVGGRRGPGNGLLAVIVLLIVLLVAWLIIQQNKDTDRGIDIDVTVPAADSGSGQ
jgi:hypothetical protein